MSEGEAPREIHIPTREEMDERIERTVRLLNRGLEKRNIKKILKKRYGVTARTCENYLARARELIIEALELPKIEHRADAVMFYRSIRDNRGEGSKERLKAQERIDKILGLEAPVKVAGTDSDGNDLPADGGRTEVIEILDSLLIRASEPFAVAETSPDGSAEAAESPGPPAMGTEVPPAILHRPTLSAPPRPSGDAPDVPQQPGT